MAPVATAVEQEKRITKDIHHLFPPYSHAAAPLSPAHSPHPRLTIHSCAQAV